MANEFTSFYDQRAARMQRERFTEEFSKVLNQFQTAQRQMAQAEKESVQRARAYSEHGGQVLNVVLSFHLVLWMNDALVCSYPAKINKKVVVSATTYEPITN